MPQLTAVTTHELHQKLFKVMSTNFMIPPVPKYNEYIDPSFEKKTSFFVDSTHLVCVNLIDVQCTGTRKMFFHILEKYREIHFGKV